MRLRDKYRLALKALNEIDGIYKGHSYRNPRLIVRKVLSVLNDKSTLLKKVKGILWTKSEY